MAYRQYTSCISASAHFGKVAVQILIAAALAALPLIAGASVVPGLIIVIAAAVIAYCRWWLYDRLICCGPDQCVVGWVLTVEPPGEKSGLDKFDTDYSINLVLPPHLVGATQAQVESDGLMGNLVKETPDCVAEGLDFSGNLVQQWGNDPMTACMHAEFEGAGVYDMMLAFLAVLGLGVAAAILCAIPIIGWIACLILMLVAAAVALVGIIVALNDTGNPNDVNSNLGEIHVNDPTGRGADMLVVQGAWVYDSAHTGWNEIHPIKHCQRIGTWEGSWSGISGSGLRDSWCSEIGKATDPLTIAAQGDPANQWTIHPVIDGCDPPPDVPK